MYDLNNPDDVIKQFKNADMSDDEITAVCEKVIEYLKEV